MATRICRLTAGRLARTKGKKVYGYLKPDVKAIVNRIVEELAKEERIAALYGLWYEQKEETYKTYSQELPRRVALADNPEFKSIRNAVIQEAVNLSAGRMKIGNMESGTPDLETASAFQAAGAEPKILDTAQLLHNAKSSQNASAAVGALRLLQYLSNIIQQRIEKESLSLAGGIDRKLRRKINEKKQAQGLHPSQ